MAAPKKLDRILESCNYRFRMVQCPQKEKPAEITAAKWQVSNQNWTKWTVVDCSLLPAGEVWCEMACLTEVESPPRSALTETKTKKT
jgi:hypothetical protein